MSINVIQNGQLTKITSGGSSAIEKIKVNGIEQEIVDKVVDIPIPTTLSDLADDADHRTVTDVEKASWNSKVDAVAGKSLMDDIEIARLADVQNYDDSALATEIQNIQNAGYITKTTDDLENYYKKSDLYNKDELDNLISSIPKFDIKVVDSLPTHDISTSTVYLVPDAGATSPDLYTEYIYADGAWEKLGTQTTADFSEFLKKTDIAAWAKNSVKPTYTAKEVGADPAGTALNYIYSLDSTLTATEGYALTGITITNGKLTSKTETKLNDSYQLVTKSEINDMFN